MNEETCSESFARLLIQYLTHKSILLEEYHDPQRLHILTLNSEHLISIGEVEIDFRGWECIRQNRNQFFALRFFLNICFKDFNHCIRLLEVRVCNPSLQDCRTKVANRFSKFVIEALNPSVKPISIIFSIRSRDSL